MDIHLIFQYVLKGKILLKNDTASKVMTFCIPQSKNLGDVVMLRLLIKKLNKLIP